MGGWIGWILKLLEDDRARDAVAQFLSLGYGSLHARTAWCEHYFGSVGLDEVASLYGHGLRHGENEVESLDSADEG